MPEVHAEVDVSVPPADFMALLVDHDCYPSFLPHIEAVEVLESSEAVWTVRYATRVIRQLHYTLRLERHGHDTLSWQLVDGFFRRNEGAWTLTATAQGTHARYDLNVELDVFLPQSITRSLIGRDLPQTLQRFADEAARRGRAG